MSSTRQALLTGMMPIGRVEHQMPDILGKVLEWATDQRNPGLLQSIWSIRYTHPQLMMALEELIESDECLEWVLSRKEE